MEGGVKGGYVHANFSFSSTPSMLFSPAPPITAIDRFLFGKNNNNKNSRQPDQQKKPCNTTTTTTNAANITTVTTTVSLPSFLGGFRDYSVSMSSDGKVDHHLDDGGGMMVNATWHTMQEINFVNGLFSDDAGNCLGEEKQPSNTEKPLPPPPSVNLVANKTKKSKGRKGKNSTILVKGQWTEQEDSKLIYLVGKYGTKKWALIAEKLIGRAGKQCRERWHNHLRPDIKKESWSQEEEILLVDAHKRFGNRWAEIARRIPGRTENSIKNHWNATKRRQISKRKNKKVVIEGGRTSILQDYIRSLNPPDDDQNPNNDVDDVQDPSGDDMEIYATVSSSSMSTSPSEGPPSQFDNMGFDSSDEYFESSPLTISDPCLDEFLFMQNLFNNNDNNNNNDVYHSVNNHHVGEVVDVTKSSLPMDNGNNHHQQIISDVTIQNTTKITSYSDWMVYSLFEGTYQEATNNVVEDSMKMMADGENDASFGKIDLDLMEMVLASQFSQASSSSSN